VDETLLVRGFVLGFTIAAAVGPQLWRPDAAEIAAAGTICGRS
jgi:hypothetical protein